MRRCAKFFLRISAALLARLVVSPRRTAFLPSCPLTTRGPVSPLAAPSKHRPSLPASSSTPSTLLPPLAPAPRMEPRTPPTPSRTAAATTACLLRKSSCAWLWRTTLPGPLSPREARSRRLSRSARRATPPAPLPCSPSRLLRHLRSRRPRTARLSLAPATTFFLSPSRPPRRTLIGLSCERQLLTATFGPKGPTGRTRRSTSFRTWHFPPLEGDTSTPSHDDRLVHYIER